MRSVGLRAMKINWENAPSLLAKRTRRGNRRKKENLNTDAKIGEKERGQETAGPKEPDRQGKMRKNHGITITVPMVSIRVPYRPRPDEIVESRSSRNRAEIGNLQPNDETAVRA